MTQEKLDEVVEFLTELLEDNTVPKNVRLKIQKILQILKGSDEESIKIDRAVLELEDIQNDSNLQPYIRTQIWNAVSMLEGL